MEREFQLTTDTILIDIIKCLIWWIVIYSDTKKIAVYSLWKTHYLFFCIKNEIWVKKDGNWKHAYHTNDMDYNTLQWNQQFISNDHCACKIDLQ